MCRQRARRAHANNSRRLDRTGASPCRLTDGVPEGALDEGCAAAAEAMLLERAPPANGLAQEGEARQLSEKPAEEGAAAPPGAGDVEHLDAIAHFECACARRSRRCTW